MDARAFKVGKENKKAEAKKVLLWMLLMVFAVLIVVLIVYMSYNRYMPSFLEWFKKEENVVLEPVEMEIKMEQNVINAFVELEKTISGALSIGKPVEIMLDIKEIESKLKDVKNKQYNLAFEGQKIKLIDKSIVGSISEQTVMEFAITTDKGIWIKADFSKIDDTPLGNENLPNIIYIRPEKHNKFDCWRDSALKLWSNSVDSSTEPKGKVYCSSTHNNFLGRLTSQEFSDIYSFLDSDENYDAVKIDEKTQKIFTDSKNTQFEEIILELGKTPKIDGRDTQGIISYIVFIRNRWILIDGKTASNVEDFKPITEITTKNKIQIVKGKITVNDQVRYFEFPYIVSKYKDEKKEWIYIIQNLRNVVSTVEQPSIEFPIDYINENFEKVLTGEY